MPHNLRVLVLEDDPDLGPAVRDFVREIIGGVDVCWTKKPRLAERLPADIIIADACLDAVKEAGAAATSRLVRYSGRTVRVIAFTKEPDTWSSWTKIATAFVSKPGGSDSTAAQSLRKLLADPSLKPAMADDPLAAVTIVSRSKDGAEGLDLALALRTAVNEAAVVKSTVPFRLSLPLRLALRTTNSRDIPRRILGDFTALCMKLAPEKRNHATELLDATGEWLKFVGEPNSGTLKELLREFAAAEPLLFADPRKSEEGAHYREHFFHAVHVALLGVWAIEKLEDARLLGDCDTLAKQWLVAALFHDVGYVLASAGRMFGRFAKSLVGVDGRDDGWLASVLSGPEFRADVSHLSAIACRPGLTRCCRHYGDVAYCPRSHIENQLMSAARSRLDHGVISALVVLRRAYPAPDPKDKAGEEKRRDQTLMVRRAAVEPALGRLLDDGEPQKELAFHRDVLAPAAVAIAMHDSVFSHCSPVWFESNPLAFLLKFCDICQQYGRVPALFGGSSRVDEDAELLGLNWSGSEKRMDVVLGCASEKRFDAVVGEAELMFARHLCSEEVAFRLVAINCEIPVPKETEAKEPAKVTQAVEEINKAVAHAANPEAAEPSKYFQMRDGSLVPHEGAKDLPGVKIISTKVPTS